MGDLGVLVDAQDLAKLLVLVYDVSNAASDARSLRGSSLYIMTIELMEAAFLLVHLVTDEELETAREAIAAKREHKEKDHGSNSK